MKKTKNATSKYHVNTKTDFARDENIKKANLLHKQKKVLSVYDDFENEDMDNLYYDDKKKESIWDYYDDEEIEEE